MKETFGSDNVWDSPDVQIKIPQIAENGTVVPVRVRTTLNGAESIGIFVENNPSTLAAAFELTPDCDSEVATRIKMGSTSKVHAVVKKGDALFRTHQEVKVTIGGCGG